MFIQGLSQEFPDKLKIKKTKKVFGKVDLLYSNGPLLHQYMCLHSREASWKKFLFYQ